MGRVDDARNVWGASKLSSMAAGASTDEITVGTRRDEAVEISRRVRTQLR